AFARYQLIESTMPGQLEREEKSLFDGIDTSIVGLAQFVNGRPPRELTDGLLAINSAVQNAVKRFDTEGPDAAVTPLLAGLRAVRVLRGRLRTVNLEDASRFEIEFLASKRTRIPAGTGSGQWPPRSCARRRWRGRGRPAVEGDDDCRQ